MKKENSILTFHEVKVIIMPKDKGYKSIIKKMEKISWINIAKYLAGIGLLILILSLLWIVTDKQYFHFRGRIDSKTAAQLGDFISGFVGIFWTAAGVVLIYATFQKQSEINNRQHFENTFFNLLNTYHSLINNASGSVPDEIKGGKKHAQGREFISGVLKEMKMITESEDFLMKLINNKNIPEIKNLENLIEQEWQKEGIKLNKKFKIKGFVKDLNKSSFSKEFVIAHYNYIYDRFQAQLGHLFRFLYNIFKFTKEEYQNDIKQQKRYINLIQAQLSSDELALLFYNALSDNAKSNDGKYTFYEWLNKSNFFENIDKNSLFHENHANWYPDVDFKFKTKINN